MSFPRSTPPAFDDVARFADAAERLFAGDRFAAWRVLAKAYLVAETASGRDHGSGAAVGFSLRNGAGDGFWMWGLDVADLERRIDAAGKKGGRDWERGFEGAVLLKASIGRATRPADPRILDLLGDMTRAAKLSAVERSARKIVDRITNEHVAIGSAIVLERRIELGSDRPRTDHFGAAIELKFQLRRDANPHRLYGEELTEADLYDWVLRSRELRWPVSDEELETVVVATIEEMKTSGPFG